ncbi:MAG TPA: family 78 glycoside hydrolase catalytic domain [Vicinamibacteria bacterium]|nr:family 78 glycoside hydrolase catalytic domain [Vicinamibacteria bacterium]
MRSLALVLLLAAVPARAASVLTVEDRVDPIGVGDPTPEFAWRLEGTAMQRAYQVQVASASDRLRAADLWDSGRVESASSAFVSYAGVPLQSRQQAFWRVRTWDAAGPGPWSEVARFEMGLLTDADWVGARWIWGDAPADHEAHFHFRAPFATSHKRVGRARAYLSATHRCDLYVDGVPVGQGPAFAYPDHQLYQTLDVTKELASWRTHFLGLTARWYGAGQGRPGARGGVLFKLVVEYEDGTSAILDSGPAWKFRRAEWRVPDAPISNANFRNGEGIPVETIDAREAPVGWTERGFDDSAWKPAVDLGPQPTAPWTGPLIAQETAIDEGRLAPVSVRTLGPGRVVADFGKVHAGRPRVVFPAGRAGTPVTVTTDYRTLPDGSLAGFAQSTKMDYGYVQRGGCEAFEPFGYLGFRYVQVDFPPRQTPPESITLIARWNRLPPEPHATFRSSDPTLDAVFDLAVHSARYGSQEHFVDTPTREQGQFTYDAYQISRAAMRAFGERDLTQRALREFAQSQVKFHADTGKVNAVYPNGDGKRDIPDWTQSWAMWAWEYFLETGDRELVADVFPQLVKTGEYVLSIENHATGLVDLGNDVGYKSGIVDWPNRYGYDRTTTQRTVMTVNAVLVYGAIASVADALGRRDTAAVYRDAQRRSEMAILTRLWDPDQSAYIDGLNADGSRSPHASQQANAMLLATGLAPEGRVASMLATVRRAGFETSPVLSRFLVEAYGEHEQDDALYDFLLNPQGRNFAAILAQGGTFTWESWEGSAAKSENSESHAYAANAALEAIQRYVLGIDVIEPQAARVRIRPHFGPLAFAEGTVPTERGMVGNAWRVGAGLPELDVTLPANVVADVYLPVPGRRAVLVMDGRTLPTNRDGAHLVARDVLPGSHRFRVRTDQEEP